MLSSSQMLSECPTDQHHQRIAVRIGTGHAFGLDAALVWAERISGQSAKVVSAIGFGIFSPERESKG
jgi:hypothetical protein